MVEGAAVIRRWLVLPVLLLTSCAVWRPHADAPIVSRQGIQIGTVTYGDMPLLLSSEGIVTSDLSPVVMVLIGVDDGQGAMLREGQSAEMSARGSSSRGRIVSVFNRSAVGSTMAIVHFGRDAPENNPGGSAEITIDAGMRPNTLYVRRPAGARADRKGSVWRLHRGERGASRVEVRYGRTAGAFVEIIEGLKAGDRVILSDLSRWSGHSYLQVGR